MKRLVTVGWLSVEGFAKLAEAIRDFDLRAQSTSIKTPKRVIALDADESGDRFDQECKNRNTLCVMSVPSRRNTAFHGTSGNIFAGECV